MKKLRPTDSINLSNVVPAFKTYLSIQNLFSMLSIFCDTTILDIDEGDIHILLHTSEPYISKQTVQIRIVRRLFDFFAEDFLQSDCT